MLPSLSRAQQKGLLVLSALVLSYLFHLPLGRPPSNPAIAPLINSAKQEVQIELEGAVQRPGLFTYPQPPTLSRVIEDGGGLKGKSKLPAQRGQETLTKDTRISILVDNAERLTVESGPLSVKSLWILGRPIPLNQATAEELDRIPGIGPGLALRMVEHRETKGPFSELEELRQVKGIGEKTLEKIRPYLTIH